MTRNEVMSIVVTAIESARKVRLAYRRQSDEVTSLHEIAPVDVRPGWTDRTRNNQYLWAWCYAEGKAEMHLVDRIEGAFLLESEFDPAAVLRDWRDTGWPLPDTWEVRREWTSA